MLLSSRVAVAAAASLLAATAAQALSVDGRSSSGTGNKPAAAAVVPRMNNLLMEESAAGLLLNEEKSRKAAAEFRQCMVGNDVGGGSRGNAQSRRCQGHLALESGGACTAQQAPTGAAAADKNKDKDRKARGLRATTGVVGEDDKAIEGRGNEGEKKTGIPMDNIHGFCDRKGHCVMKKQVLVGSILIMCDEEPQCGWCSEDVDGRKGQSCKVLGSGCEEGDYQPRDQE